ncbi:type II toxin-antitoxin system RelB/DinJ family antitoxin [Lapidilactobacillus mulanensis]|uniref:Type II toxin-antitoxin system RelB/DinJ family antitoxin n=1 Tax=Lapidilactobacillus mulanensis TaxID=2485999 RepID=A0ABW4DSF6_9LACO|nr:type II toxin-antitoxin system RelB/DinJ family antitoxin [Lapidilactobacillus mulanensis]
MDIKEKKSTVSARVSVELKESAARVANSMGMDMSTAITMFLTQMVRKNALPFTPIGSPLDAAIQEIKDGQSKSFTSIESLMADLNSDDEND